MKGESRMSNDNNISPKTPKLEINTANGTNRPLPKPNRDMIVPTAPPRNRSKNE